MTYHRTAYNNKYINSTNLSIAIIKVNGHNPTVIILVYVYDPGKYRGITLLSQVLKLLEILEGDFWEEQQGFRKGRGTADGMYVMRQMVEKRLEAQGSMALGFVDLEKGF